MAPKHPYIDEARKGAFLTLLDEGDPIPSAAKKAKINTKTARGIKKRADQIVIFNDTHNLPPPSLHDQVSIAPKPGRPHVLSELDINTLDCTISSDRHHREMGQFEVAQELDLKASKSTIRTAARSHKIHRVKPTKKLGLTPIQMAERYEIALSRKDWTLDDWKRVVFSDEASILVGEHWGPNKISRKPDERYNPDCIEVRYNNYSEAMFWGCFSYDFKGPSHVYHPETADEKIKYKKMMDDHNAAQMDAIQEEWDKLQVVDAIKWTALGRKKPGKPALFENFVKNHPRIMKREKGKGGIDYVRYKAEVLEPLLVPFMKAIDQQRPHDPDSLESRGFIFQQDNAPSHKSHWTLEYLAQQGIELLEHPGNSPDMNASEKAWMPMRIDITKVWNRPHTLEWTERAWYAEWEALEQDDIREWIHHMMEVNQRILDHEGGNEFHG
jgi:hypothetical protein